MVSKITLNFYSISSNFNDVLLRLCNKIFVTDDNPRNEKPETIRKEIISSQEMKVEKEDVFQTFSDLKI